MFQEDISVTIEKATPTLSRAEKDLLWAEFEKKVATPKPVLSPYLFFVTAKKHMAPIALALILMLSTTGVVAASNDARPGDTLFLIDQTVEDIRLALASNDSKTRLEAEFAAERLLELSSILDEALNKDALRVAAGGTISASSTGTSTTSRFEAEADVFTDTTIVEVEINDRKTVFETSADTKAEVVAEIVRRFGVASATVEAALNFEVENRASRTEDKDNLVLSSKDEVRVNEAIAITLSYLLKSGLASDTRDSLFTELAGLLDGVPVNIDSEKIRLTDGNSRVEIRNYNDDNRLEIRDGENRIRIREKDGEIRIDTKGDWGSDNDNDDDDRDDDDASDDDRDEDDDRSSSSSTFEAEADVFIDTTIVEVEINDRKSMFKTSADTKAGVVNEIVSRYGIDRATVEAALDFEIEDRASRTDDSIKATAGVSLNTFLLTDDSDDDRDEDDDRDRDDDRDEDKSGKDDDDDSDDEDDRDKDEDDDRDEDDDDRDRDDDRDEDRD